MACLSVIVQLDGFQHGDEEFHVKAVAMTTTADRTYRVRRFDSSELLANSKAAIQTYRLQAEQHGWPLNSPGLPQCAVETVILTFLQDALLDAAEVGNPVPPSIIIWTKGRNQERLFSSYLLAVQPLPMPIIVRNLPACAETSHPHSGGFSDNPT